MTPAARSLVLLAALGAAVPPPAAAQVSALAPAAAQEGPVSLVADRVTYDADAAVLIAEGDVEVYYGDRTLTADRIVYDAAANRVRAEGDIVLRGPEGAVIAADLAELDAELREGLMEGARAAMPGEARFAAAEGRRIDGRWNVMSRAVFSPCAVCAADPTPLWRIRADRIVHDERARVIHYENATFDVLGQPVFWTPYFRHPDPTLRRASGFLPPDFIQSRNLGYAVKTPWHWVIDDASDATFTPFPTTEAGLAGEAEYRRRFADGALWLSGSLAQDAYDGDGSLRGHLFGQGVTRLAGPIEAGFSLEQASDDGYLKTYEFTDRDRLTSEAFVRGGAPDWWGEVSAVRFQSLRDDEPAGDIPRALPAFEGRRVWPEAAFGGDLGLDLSGYALSRTNGQDTARGTVGLDWERRWIDDSSGLAFGAFASARGDAWKISDDPAGAPDDERARFAPVAAVEARYPLLRRDAGGDALSRLIDGGDVTHLIEPVAQGVLAPYVNRSPSFPDEDSALTEFDETNVFDLRRHAGDDGFEEGPRLNLGLRYARFSEFGPDVSLSAGRVLRARGIDSFAEGAGLNGVQSDFVGAWTVDLPGVFSVSQRLRIGDDLGVTRNEIYARAAWEGLEFEGSYVVLSRNAANPVRREEVATAGRVPIDRNWYLGLQARRDLEAESWVRTGGEIGYRNECVDLAVYGERDFTRTADVPATTSFGLRVRLWALGGDAGPGSVSGACAPRRE